MTIRRKEQLSPPSRRGFWKLVLIVAVFGAGAACRQDMQDQPKYKPLGENSFFPDGRDARPVPVGTIAIDELNDNDGFHTGQANGAFLDTIPVPVTETLLHRGQQRFNIYCSPCHGYIGDGNGMVARRGFRAPPSFHTERLRSVPPGYIFAVISNGFGGMPAYSDAIQFPDRWAIVAYVRALQYSRNASVNDVPPDLREELNEQGTASPK